MGNIIQMIMNLFFGGNQKKEVKELDKQIKVKDNEVKELEKEVKVLESKKRVNKKEVAKLKRGQFIGEISFLTGQPASANVSVEHFLPARLYQ